MNDATLFLEHLKQLIPSKNALVLDIGCGPGRFSDLQPGCYIGFDVTADDYQPGLPRIVDVVGSARFLPFHSDSLDLVFAVAAFHLFPGPSLCLQEIFRCLKPGGRFVCFEYTRRTLERLSTHYYESHIPQHSIFSRSSLLRMFRRAGFSRVKISIPSTQRSFKTFLARPVFPVYQLVHDYFEGWWCLDGLKKEGL